MVADEKSAKLGVLKWEVTYEVQKECIDHLSFIIDPHIDKLHIEVVDEVAALPREVGVNINLLLVTLQR